jgi:hypothetical protein
MGKMSKTPITNFPDCSGSQVSQDKHSLRFIIESTHQSAPCPSCQQISDQSEWQRIAHSADISIAAYQHMYSGFSGYVPSDGLSSFQLAHNHEADFDFMAEFYTYFVTGLVANMIADHLSTQYLVHSKCFDALDDASNSYLACLSRFNPL